MRIVKVQRPDSGATNGMRSHDVEMRWFKLVSLHKGANVLRREAESAFKARRQWAIELQCSAQSIMVELDE